MEHVPLVRFNFLGELPLRQAKRDSTVKKGTIDLCVNNGTPLGLARPVKHRDQRRWTMRSLCRGTWWKERAHAK